MYKYNVEQRSNENRCEYQQEYLPYTADNRFEMRITVSIKMRVFNICTNEGEEG